MRRAWLLDAAAFVVVMAVAVTLLAGRVRRQGEAVRVGAEVTARAVRGWGGAP